MRIFYDSSANFFRLLDSKATRKGFCKLFGFFGGAHDYFDAVSEAQNPIVRGSLAVQQQLKLAKLPEPADVADAIAIALCHHFMTASLIGRQ